MINTKNINQYFLYGSVICAAIIFSCAALVYAQQGKVQIPDVVQIPAGKFIQGSSQEEREYAYSIDEKAYGHDVTRQQKWYAREFPTRQVHVKSYAIGRTPITNAQYANFVKDTGHLAPFVDEETWETYGLIHPYHRVKSYLWHGDKSPKGKENHPVVLVSYKDAQAYVAWLSQKTGQRWRLPHESQWEKAARGDKGNIFPWGNQFQENYLNSHDKGPFKTMPVGSFPQGSSPYGVLDMAGQVFEWTRTADQSGRFIVKGGSWDDKGCGVCRSAARHGRPKDLKHILIGFRVVQEEDNKP